MSRPKSNGHSAGRGIQLDITEEIVNAAIPRDSSHCVVADALKAAVPDAQRIAVDLQTIAFTDPVQKRRYVYLTPAVLQRLLVDFDQGYKPQAFKIRLGHPAQIRRSGHKRVKSENEPNDEPNDGVPTGNKRVLSDKRREGPRARSVVLGGPLPPTAALSNRRGRRREFGIRSLRS